MILFQFFTKRICCKSIKFILCLFFCLQNSVSYANDDKLYFHSDYDSINDDLPPDLADEEDLLKYLGNDKEFGEYDFYSDDSLDLGYDHDYYQGWKLQETSLYDLFDNKIHNIYTFGDIYYTIGEEEKVELESKKACFFFSDINNKKSEIKISIIKSKSINKINGISDCVLKSTSLNPMAEGGNFNVVINDEIKTSVPYYIKDNIISIDPINKQSLFSVFKNNHKDSIVFNFSLDSYDSQKMLYVYFDSYNFEEILSRSIGHDYYNGSEFLNN